METTTTFETVDTLVKGINSYKENSDIEIQNEIARMNHLRSKMNEKLDALSAVLPSLIESLKVQHLAIKSLGYNKTGIDYKVWDEKDSLRINITAVPTSEKFKFLQFAGYTSRGSGKNEDRLRSKSEKIAGIIKEKTGLTSVHVNPYSLELRDNKTTKSVLIEAWI